MNKKITFPLLVDELAVSSGVTDKLTEEFLKELFSLISSALADGEIVKVKRIGTFRVVDIESGESISAGKKIDTFPQKDVVFIPDQDLADAVNQPFSMFEPLILPDGVTAEELEDMDRNMDQETGGDHIEPDNLQYESEESDSKTVLGLTDEEHKETEPLGFVEWSDDVDEAQEKEIPEIDENPDKVISVAEPESDEEDAGDEDVVDEKPGPDSSEIKVGEVGIDSNVRVRSGKGFLSGYFLGIASALVLLAIVLIILRFAQDRPVETYIYPESETRKVELAVAETAFADTVEEIRDTLVSYADVKQEEVPTRPSDEIVYDTISTTRFLTTMAKDHYGNYNLWPYIYEENKAMLGHPDRIRPGTKVVIPPAVKYGIDAADPECIRKAKRMGVDIYSRYRP